MTAGLDIAWVRGQVEGTAPPVSDSPYVDQMWTLLHDRAAGFMQVKEGVKSAEIIAPRRGLLHDESASFLRAVHAGVAAVDWAGYITLPTVMAKSPIGRYALFSRSGTAMSVNLEYVIQVGVTAELMLDHGFPAHQVGFERGEFDAVVHDDSGRVVVAMEAKARVTGSDSLEQLVTKWMSFAADPTADLDNNAGRKWRELAAYCSSGPVSVLLVADSARWWLKATMDSGRLKVTPA